ncbi:MAG TPA: glycosyltransferase, partial [Thermodesulfobacteriota bacterium]|nr:glycosyltransferase [Thermodesulfobacteriota bacterium]
SEYGYGLDPVLKWVSRSRDNLIGILNGIDYEKWDPSKDASIYERFGPDTADKKKLNKAALREELGLDPEGDKPLLGVVSKLTEQKGIDLVLDSIPQILDLGYQMVVVGAGVERYEHLFEKAGKRWKKNLSVNIAVNDNELERKVFAGSDMFLMPSRFEPCGLGQITALRYGTIPVVRGTGGLLDTVRDYTEDSEKGNGFVFYEFSKIGMLDALLRAISAYEDKDKWRGLILRGMREDFSWRSSGKEYLRIYGELMENRQRISGNKN